MGWVMLWIMTRRDWSSTRLLSPRRAEASEFGTWWATHFGAKVPLGWMLREEMPARWMRIHSLPRSKRYAETEAERRVLLQRQNALARTVLGEGAPCWIVVARYTASARPTMRPPRLRGLDSRLRLSFSFPNPWREDDRDRSQGDVWCARVRWRPGAFDTLLQEIADWRESGVLWASRSGQIFAPYDGGVDVFTRTKFERDNLKWRFRAWLSQRADGK